MLAESSAAMEPKVREHRVLSVADEHGALFGALLVIPNDDQGPAKMARKRLLALVDGRISAALTRRAQQDVDPAERLAEDVLRETEDARGEIAIYAMRFTLFRKGECRIWFDLREFLGRDLTAEPPTRDELLTAQALPKQAYYFVQDLLHAHYHHEASSDQILQLSRVSGRDGSDATVRRDEVRWRYVTLRGLMRVVVELRQGRSLQGPKRALGIIAYANAFQMVLGRIVRQPRSVGEFDLDESLAAYEFDNLTRSIKATDLAIESVTGSRLQLFAIEVGILPPGLALWAGAVQIQPILCATKDITCPKIGLGPIVSIVNNVVANPIGFIVLLIALGFLLFVAFFRGTGAIPWAERFVRWLKSLADAIASDAAFGRRGYDIFGWLLALTLLAALFVGAVKLAYWLVPKTHVPLVETQPPPNGAWSQLQGYVGKPVGSSGLFTMGVAAQSLRGVLEADFYAHLRALEAAPLKREGDVFYAVSSGSASDDGGYIVLDSSTTRIEAGLRTDGHPHPHRSLGGEIKLPREVLSFVRSSGGFDVDPVPVAQARCDIGQGGLNGSTLQLQGSMAPGEPCPYRIFLAAGQTLRFNPRRAEGLFVSISERGTEKPFVPKFTASVTGKHVAHVGWKTMGAERPQAVRLRPF